MNYGRIALAAVVAAVVDFAYGGLIYGNLLTSQFAKYPNIYRAPDTQVAFLPALFGGILAGMFFAVLIYAKGYEGKSGLLEGIRFGVIMGLFLVFYVLVTTWATVNIGKDISLAMTCAGMVEWVIVGAVIGLVYKPARV